MSLSNKNVTANSAILNHTFLCRGHNYSSEANTRRELRPQYYHRVRNVGVTFLCVKKRGEAKCQTTLRQRSIPGAVPATAQGDIRGAQRPGPCRGGTQLFSFLPFRKHSSILLSTTVFSQNLNLQNLALKKTCAYKKW